MLDSVPIELLIAGVLALYMAWAIGANDVAIRARRARIDRLEHEADEIRHEIARRCPGV